LIDDTEKQFIDRNKEFKNRNKQTIYIPKKVIIFLKVLYRTNEQYNYSISYIKGKVKHETPNKFGEKAKTQLNAKIMSNHNNPIQHNNDGSLEISGFMKAEPGSNIFMSNVSISTPNGNIIIDHLTYSGTPFEGDKIIFSDNIKINFIDWANDCIEICKKIIEQYKKTINQ